MGVHDGADIAVATAVRHLLALRRETEIPGALLDVLAIRAHAAACRIHEILREYLPAYREACCMDLDTLILADNVVPAVPEALVCVQWVAAPLEGIRSDSGIYPTVGPRPPWRCRRSCGRGSIRQCASPPQDPRHNFCRCQCNAAPLCQAPLRTSARWWLHPTGTPS